MCGAVSNIGPQYIARRKRIINIESYKSIRTRFRFRSTQLGFFSQSRAACESRSYLFNPHRFVCVKRATTAANGCGLFLRSSRVRTIHTFTIAINSARARRTQAHTQVVINYCAKAQTNRDARGDTTYVCVCMVVLTNGLNARRSARFA